MSLDTQEREFGRDGNGGDGRGRSDWAYDMLHEAIREGAIEPGQRVMEPEVSAWLRISRTPVREAMRRLQAEGLLEHAPGGGLAVALYDLRAIGEFYATRESLEGTAAALAARNADDTELRILSATLEAMRALPDDPRAHARENRGSPRADLPSGAQPLPAEEPARAAELRAAARTDHLSRPRAGRGGAT